MIISSTCSIRHNTSRLLVVSYFPWMRRRKLSLIDVRLQYITKFCTKLSHETRSQHNMDDGLSMQVTLPVHTAGHRLYNTRSCLHNLNPCHRAQVLASARLQNDDAGGGLGPAACEKQA